MATTYYSEKCSEFRARFAEYPDITTFESDDENGGQFDGSVYRNKIEWLQIFETEPGNWMVFINNPESPLDENGCPIQDGPQWVFGYYDSFKRALRKMESIMRRGKYPKPIEINE